MNALIVLLLGIISIIVYFEVFHRSTRLIRKIPGPKWWPIIGSALNLLKKPQELFYYSQYLAKEYGNILQIHAINLQVILISDPVDVEKILSSSNYNKKRDPYTFLKPWLGEGLLISNDDKWHKRRKLLTQAFHFNILKKYMMTVKNVTEEFLNNFYNQLNEENVNVVTVAQRITLEIMCETAMNISINKLESSQREKYVNSINTMGECVFKRTTNILLSSDSIFNLSKYSTFQNKALQYLHKFTKDIIKERRKVLKGSGDDIFGHNSEMTEGNTEDKKKLALLDLLLYKEKQGLIDIKGIREEVDTFMFEGHDTSATLLSFMLMRIANEPRVQEKIFEELKGIFGSSKRLPTLEDLNDMRYLECCIKESLRIYPSVPLISRYLTKDTVLGNYTIPANTTCYINLYGIHHNADHHPEPEKFMPERFSTDNPKIKHPFSYIPFSAGPRNCIGQKFAMMEIKMIVSGILRRFHLEPVTNTSDIVFTSDLVLRCTNSIYVSFKKRKFEY